MLTSYTRWVDAVQVRAAENQEVYLTFSLRFEHVWLESKKRLLEYVVQKAGQYWTPNSIKHLGANASIEMEYK